MRVEVLGAERLRSRRVEIHPPIDLLVCHEDAEHAQSIHLAFSLDLAGCGVSGYVAESADDVLVEAEVLLRSFHGQLAVKAFTDAEVELARVRA